MRRFFFYSLLALALGTALAVYLQDDPGYVLVNFRGWSFETSLANLVLALLALFILLGGVLWFVRLINPLKLLRKSTWRKLLSGGNPELASANGIQLLLLGKWQDAYRILVENAERVKNPMANYLAAAIAAFERGDQLGWQFCLDRAEKKAGQNIQGVRSLRGLLEQRAGHPEQALTILQSIRRVAPGSPFVLRQLKDIYLQLPDWQRLEELIPDLEKYKVLDAGAISDLQVMIFQHQLTVAGNEGPAAMRAAWQEMPKALRNDEKLVAQYLRKLLDQDEDSEAGSLLSNFLKQKWSDNVIGMVGHLKGGNPQHLLLLLEGWLKERPNNAVLMLTLGRLSLRNHLWGKARDYFEHALKVSKSNALTAEISAELGRLLEHLGEHERSLECYQQAMSLMDHKLPDLPMPALNR